MRHRWKVKIRRKGRGNRSEAQKSEYDFAEYSGGGEREYNACVGTGRESFLKSTDHR